MRFLEFDLRSLQLEEKRAIERKVKSIIGVENAYKLFRVYNTFITKIKSPSAYKNWRSNSKYKGCHRGERCFILGNGPSLKDVDLNLLKDEFVFTVNNFAMMDNYQKAKTNVHIWNDSTFYNKGTYKIDDALLMENYKKIAEEKPICFVPLAAFEFMHSKKLEKKLNINYYAYGRSFEKSKTKYIKLDGYIYRSAVVQAAIQIAIYMGFCEIYLLGCDATGIVPMLNTALGNSDIEAHAYSNDYQNEFNQTAINTRSMVDIIYDEYRSFLGFRRLNEYCKEHCIKLYNCSSKTLIDDISRKKLEDVLEK